MGGVAITSSSSNSGELKSTSGEGESSRLRSASASSDRDAADEMEGEMMAREMKGCVEGSGMGWWA